MDRLMTVKEVAALLRLPDETVRRWHRDPAHPLTGFHVGRGLRFDRAEVEAYLAAVKAERVVA